MEVDWERYRSLTTTNTIIWAVLIILILLFAIKFRNSFSRGVIRILCFVLSIIQIGTLVYVERTTVMDEGELDWYASKEGEFDLSKNENTIVLIIDTMDAQWFDDFILPTSATTNELKDFTYFDNAVAGGAPTWLGIPAILSGKAYQPTEAISEYYEHAYPDSTLFRDVKSEGWSMQMYFQNLAFLENADFNLFDNFVHVPHTYSILGRKNFLKDLYKITGYYLSPMITKKYLAETGNPLEDNIVIDDIDDAYKVYDPDFYIDMNKNGITTTREDNLLTVYLLYGAHGPSYMNENAEAIESTTSDEAHTAQIKGLFKLLYEYLDYLKAADIYDSSTVIITADHGGQEYFQNPTILIKQPNVTQEELVIKHSPVMFENLYNSIAKSMLKNDSHYGEDLFDVEEDLVIERKHSVQTINVARILFPEEPIFQKTDVVQVTFYGDARDLENISYSGDTCYPKVEE